MEIEEQDSEGQEGAGKHVQTNVDQVAANAAVDSFLDDIAGDTGPPNDGGQGAGLEEDHLPSSQELEHLFDETIPEPAPNTTSGNHVAQASTSPIPPSSTNTNGSAAASSSSSSTTTSTHQAKDRILSMFAKKPTAVPPRPLPSLHSNLRLSTSKPIAVASRTTVSIDKERARLLHEETTLRMAKQRETMARNAEAANKRLMAEKQKLAELIRAKDASSSSVAQVSKTTPATALEQEETLEDTELQVADNLHMDEPQNSSANLAVPPPEPQTQIQLQAHAEAQAEPSDAAAKAISREAELKRRLKRQRLPSDSESSDVPAKKTAVEKANSPVPAPAPLSGSTTVQLEQSHDKLVPQPGQAASSAQLDASSIGLENQESSSDQATSSVNELPPSAVLPQPTQQQQQVPRNTLPDDPPVASTSKLPPPAKAKAKAKAKPKQPRKLIPVVEIPYKKIVIPPP
jgi:hypothetical protein